MITEIDTGDFNTVHKFDQDRFTVCMLNVHFGCRTIPFMSNCNYNTEESSY